jgi:hypothetical protein
MLSSPASPEKWQLPCKPCEPVDVREWFSSTDRILPEDIDVNEAGAKTSDHTSMNDKSRQIFFAAMQYLVERYQFFAEGFTKLLVITPKLRTITSLRHQYITGNAFNGSRSCMPAFAVRAVSWFTDNFALEPDAELHASGRYRFQ